ncbi:MAG: Ig-like domain-containing protein [Rikenellaceae bacterium]
MKKIFMLLFVATVFFACEESDDPIEPEVEDVVPEETPDEDDEYYYGEITYVTAFTSTLENGVYEVASAGAYNLSLLYSVFPEDATYQGLSFTLYSDPDSIVTNLTSTGVVTISDFGTATFIINAQDPHVYYEYVTIEFAEGAFAIVDPIHALMIGSYKQLSTTIEDETYTWSSDNTSIATVDQAGKVLAVAEGTANITAVNSVGELATLALDVAPKGIICLDFSEEYNATNFLSLCGFSYQTHSATISHDSDHMVMTPNNSNMYFKTTSATTSEEYPIFAFKAHLSPLSGNTTAVKHFSIEYYNGSNGGTLHCNNSGDSYSPDADMFYYGVATVDKPQIYNMDFYSDSQFKNGSNGAFVTSGSTLSNFQFKIYSTGSYDGYIEVYWMYHFKSVSEFEEFMAIYEFEE